MYLIYSVRKRINSCRLSCENIFTKSVIIKPNREHIYYIGIIEIINNSYLDLFVLSRFDFCIVVCLNKI
jgi:hypothetical protein